MHYQSFRKGVGDAVRLAEVVQVLVHHGFADLVRRIGLHEGLPAKVLRGLRILEAPSGELETLGKRLCAACTDLGPAFIKFGQVLSTRPDLVGPEMANELGRLQDRVEPLPFDTMAEVLQETLDAPIDEVFADFDKTPVAAASLSQVYRATLKTGEIVAIKIQRPDIERVIQSDLRLMQRIAEWASEHLHDIEWIDPPATVDEFARSIRRELDFTIEARTIERFRKDFERDPHFVVPKTYAQWTTPRVLIMDWVDGVRVDRLDAYEERTSDPKTVAAIGCRILCQQVFENRMFHADPHPGNIMLLRDNRIAFLDYGMVGHLERPDVAAIAELLRAIFQQDSEACVHALLLLTTTGDTDDHEALEHEIAEYIAFEAQAIVSRGQVRRAIEQATEVLRRNHLQLASRFSLLLKALVTIETVGHQLDPQLDMVPIIRPYVERIVAERYALWQIVKDTHSSLVALLRLGTAVPRDLQQLLRMLRRGRLKIQLNHEGLSHLAGVTDAASNRIAFGVITGSLIIGSSLLMTANVGVRGLGLAGYIIAGLLGLGLVISILRSKNY